MDTKKYDLHDDNLKTIQSLIAIEQHRLIKSGGFNKGPAYYKACENVGQSCIIPQVGGPELAAWVGARAGIHARRIGGNGEFSVKKDKPQMYPMPVAIEPQNKSRIGVLDRADVGKPTINYDVQDVIDLDPPEFFSRSIHNSENHKKWQAAWERIKAAPIGEMFGITLADKAAATRCQTSCTTFSKKKLHSTENGWKLRSMIDKRRQNVLWFMKVPIE